MANNRIYLKCEGCGGLLFLGKRFAGGYCWHNYAKDINAARANDPNWKKQDDRPLEDRLNDFYEAHEWCGDSLDHFRITYEMDDDFTWKSEEAPHAADT